MLFPSQLSRSTQSTSGNRLPKNNRKFINFKLIYMKRCSFGLCLTFCQPNLISYNHNTSLVIKPFDLVETSIRFNNVILTCPLVNFSLTNDYPDLVVILFKNTKTQTHSSLLVLDSQFSSIISLEYQKSQNTLKSIFSIKFKNNKLKISNFLM